MGSYETKKINTGKYVEKQIDTIAMDFWASFRAQNLRKDTV